MTKFKKDISIQNRRARFDYEILETWVAGIVLRGTEIKSLRMGQASLRDAFCYFNRGELYIRGLNISQYSWASLNNHDPHRDRKLLLQRRELDRIERSMMDNRALTIVGLRIFINEKGLAKVVIGLARGRKEYDKREYIKERDAKRQMSEALKQ